MGARSAGSQAPAREAVASVVSSALVEVLGHALPSSEPLMSGAHRWQPLGRADVSPSEPLMSGAHS